MDEIKIEIANGQNNVVFFCAIEKKHYNISETKAYNISFIVGIDVLPNGQSSLRMGKTIICEHCWEKNKDNKEGLNFKEPSKIIKPAKAKPDFRKN